MWQIYYRLTPLEYKQIINYVKINGNYMYRRKIVEKETTKSADDHTRDAPSNKNVTKLYRK